MLYITRATLRLWNQIQAETIAMKAATPAITRPMIAPVCSWASNFPGSGFGISGRLLKGPAVSDVTPMGVPNVAMLDLLDIVGMVVMTDRDKVVRVVLPTPLVDDGKGSEVVLALVVLNGIVRTLIVTVRGGDVALTRNISLARASTDACRAWRISAQACLFEQRTSMSAS